MSADATTDHNPAPGCLLRKVPGRARPQKQVLALFREEVAELRRRYKPEFWLLFIPKAEDMYRWRVQLECGCTRELFTRGESRFPDEDSDTDPLTGYRLPSGELRCAADHGPVPKIYRDIVEWIKSDVKEFPVDPEEPKYGMTVEDWAMVRHAEPHSSAFWTVKLACGHVSTSVITEVGWTPEEGPRLVSEERAAEICKEFEALWSNKPGHQGWPREGSERDHVRKMIELRWPRPEPEQECRACICAKRITGYQRIGWLVSKTLSAPPKLAIDRKKVEAKLAAAEAEVQLLRKQLDEAV